MAGGALHSRRRFLGLGALAAAAATACARRSPGAPAPAESSPVAPLALRNATSTPPYQVAAPLPAAGAAPLSSPPAGGPAFANVDHVTPDQAALYFAGKLLGFPGATIDNYLGYSPADLLESMDTVWVDDVGRRHGDAGLQTIYGLIARALLDGLIAIYGPQPVVLALDAGHGGNPAFFYDAGSNGTEAQHTRAVVSTVEAMAGTAAYETITLRRIFNDNIADDFGLPPPQDNKTRAQLVMRNARASMLAYQADAWNRSHPDRLVAVHVVSVHFNANSLGTLVLHEGDDVPADFARRSLAYARYYVEHARPALNASGLLSQQLALVGGTGLHDDSLMYAPPVRAGGPRVNPLTGNVPKGPPRYAMLQASLLEQDYVLGLLRYRGLA